MYLKRKAAFTSVLILLSFAAVIAKAIQVGDSLQFYGTWYKVKANSSSQYDNEQLFQIEWESEKNPPLVRDPVFITGILKVVRVSNEVEQGRLDNELDIMRRFNGSAGFLRLFYHGIQPKKRPFSRWFRSSPDFHHLVFSFDLKGLGSIDHYFDPYSVSDVTEDGPEGIVSDKLGLRLKESTHMFSAMLLSLHRVHIQGATHRSLNSGCFFTIQGLFPLTGIVGFNAATVLSDELSTQIHQHGPPNGVKPAISNLPIPITKSEVAAEIRRAKLPVPDPRHLYIEKQKATSSIYKESLAPLLNLEDVQRDIGALADIFFPLVNRIHTLTHQSSAEDNKGPIEKLLGLLINAKTGQLDSTFKFLIGLVSLMAEYPMMFGEFTWFQGNLDPDIKLLALTLAETAGSAGVYPVRQREQFDQVLEEPETGIKDMQKFDELRESMKVLPSVPSLMSGNHATEAVQSSVSTLEANKDDINEAQFDLTERKLELVVDSINNALAIPPEELETSVNLVSSANNQYAQEFLPRPILGIDHVLLNSVKPFWKANAQGVTYAKNAPFDARVLDTSLVSFHSIMMDDPTVGYVSMRHLLPTIIYLETRIPLFYSERMKTPSLQYVPIKVWSCYYCIKDSFVRLSIYCH